MVVTNPNIVIAQSNIAQKVRLMRHVKACTTIRYPLLTYEITTFLIMCVIVSTKHALRKTTHSLTAVVLALRTSA